MHNNHFSFSFADPKAPSLEVRTLSDYNNAFLVGHNFSVVCTSNSSKEYEFEREDAQPNWIGMFYDTGIQKACSLKGDLREDTMTCTMVISNATIESSGNYSCMAQNEMMCTIITTLVVVEGIGLIVLLLICFVVKSPWIFTGFLERVYTRWHLIHRALIFLLSVCF